jgi:hypothetical protein
LLFQLVRHVLARKRKIHTSRRHKWLFCDGE